MRLLSICIFIFSSVGFADDWETQYANLCKRDSYCTRLRYSDGTWYTIKPEVSALLKDPIIQDTIKATATKMGVDPLAIAGAIATENSLNVGVKRGVLDYLTFGQRKKMETELAKRGITSLPGKGEFSFGLGEIHMDRAEEAENYIAKLEHRQPRDHDTLRKLNLTPTGSIELAGEIMRKTQDDYKAQGFDISKNLGVLATAYNLGHTEDKAKADKANNTPPQINYFGLFVEKYTTDLTNIVNLKTNISSSVTAPQGNTKVVQKLEVQEVPVALKKIKEKSLTNDLVQSQYVTKTLPLIQSPQTCKDSLSGQNLAAAARSVAFGAPIGSIEKGESYTEISRGLDCNAEAWTLIKTSSGNIGWIKADKIEAATSTRYEVQRSCGQNSFSSQCKSQIAGSTTPYKIDSLQTDLIYLKPITAPGNTHIGFKNEDLKCGFKQPETAQRGGSSPPEDSPEALTPAQFASAEKINIKKIDGVLKNMSRQTHFYGDSLESPANPYSQVANLLISAKSTAVSCLNQLDAEFYTCRNPRGLSKVLDELDKTKFEQLPDFNKVADLQAKVSNEVSNNINGAPLQLTVYEPDIDEIAKTSPVQIRQAVTNCKIRFKKLKAESINSTSKKPPNIPATSGMGWPGGFGGGLITGPDSVERTFDAIEKGTDDQLNKYKSSFIKFSKVCEARTNLINSSEKNNCTVCSSGPKYFNMNLQIYRRDILTRLFKSEPLLAYDWVGDGLRSTVNFDALDEIAPLPVDEGNEVLTSYCPNKTKEFIQNLLEKNPCIKRVYVPSRYLSNALSGFGDKVIFREFAEGDRYAIDLGGGSCN